MSVGGRAAQFTGMNGRPRRRLLLWRALANNSRPCRSPEKHYGGIGQRDLVHPLHGDTQRRAFPDDVLEVGRAPLSSGVGMESPSPGAPKPRAQSRAGDRRTERPAP